MAPQKNVGTWDLLISAVAESSTKPLNSKQPFPSEIQDWMKRIPTAMLWSRPSSVAPPEGVKNIKIFALIRISSHTIKHSSRLMKDYKSLNNILNHVIWMWCLLSINFNFTSQNNRMFIRNETCWNFQQTRTGDDFFVTFWLELLLLSPQLKQRLNQIQVIDLKFYKRRNFKTYKLINFKMNQITTCFVASENSTCSLAAKLLLFLWDKKFNLNLPVSQIRL